MPSLLDMLGYVGDSLDKPGRAVRGLLSGNSREGLAAIPFSDTMGLTDPAERVSGSALLRNLGVGSEGDDMGSTLAGIGTEIATDPLSWIGVGLGAKLGSAAGKAAVARGPRYETTIDDMARMGGFADEAALSSFNPRNAATPKEYLAAERLQELARSPGIEDALRELPPGSRMGGAGKEGAAFFTPQNDVVRIGGVSAGQKGRPVSDMMLQPNRTVDFRETGRSGLRAERMPMAEGVGTVPEAEMLGLRAEAQDQGMNFWDKLEGNMGYHGGRPVVIDPGAVTVGKDFAGDFNPVVRGGEPGFLMSRLLDSLGSTDMIRRGMTPDFTRRLGALGGGIGATAGASSRL